jgi:heme-degrading monooxygenase HmoA
MSNHQTGGRVAVIARYEVLATEQEELAAALDGELRRWISEQPGFVSGTVYRSIDQLHIVISTLWERERDGLAYTQASEAQKMWAKVRSSSARLRDSHTYRAGDPVLSERS